MAELLSSKDLPRLWCSADNSRLMPKQISVRLPVHVAAKLFALEEMYPTRTRTQLIGDLLSSALQDVAQGLSSVQGDYWGTGPDGEHLYKDIGELGTFVELTSKYLRELEGQLGNKSTPTITKAVMQGPPPDEEDRS